MRIAVTMSSANENTTTGNSTPPLSNYEWMDLQWAKIVAALKNDPLERILDLLDEAVAKSLACREIRYWENLLQQHRAATLWQMGREEESKAAIERAHWLMVNFTSLLITSDGESGNAEQTESRQGLETTVAGESPAADDEK